MSLRLKIIALLLAFAAIVGAYLAFVWGPEVEDRVALRLKAVTESHLDTAVEALIPFLIQGEYASVNESLEALQARNPEWTQVELYSWNGMRIYPLGATAAPIVADQNLQQFEREISFQGSGLGRMVVMADLRPALNERRDEVLNLAWVLAAVFALALVGAYVMLEIMVRRPLSQLGAAASELASGDFNAHLPKAARDEIGALTKTFADMRESLQNAQSALQDSKAKFRDYSESAADWYWEMDANLHFSVVSRRYTDITGTEAGFFLGSTQEEAGNPGVKEVTWRAHLEDLHEHRAFRNFVYPSQTAEGKTVWFQISGKPLFDDENDGAFMGYRGTGSDISQLKAAELHLQQAKDEAERAQAQAEEANRAKSSFLSSMSHELRTPLNAILGFGQLLKMGKLAKNQTVPVEQILKSGNHLLVLINEVLDLAKIDTGNISLSIEDVRARDVIDHCISMASTLADAAGITVVDRTQGQDLPLVRADNTRLIQALLNLLSNAVKYNRLNGEVVLEVKREGAMLRFEVTDQGKGISPENHDKLFEPFNRLGAESSSIEGTGIGLAITKELVKLMDGELAFQSQPGQGSTFWIDIPVAHGSPDILEHWPEQAHELPYDMTHVPDGGRIQVLYIEDNRANSDLMEAIFGELNGYELVVAGTAEEGLARIDLHHPNLILMDIDLPGMNGDEAMEIIKARQDTKHIPIIAVSADAMPDAIKVALSRGFDDYITKPFDLMTVVNAVEEVGQQKQA
ncbi:ATP-binding protein [Pseudomonadota bacterium]